MAPSTALWMPRRHSRGKPNRDKNNMKFQLVEGGSQAQPKAPGQLGIVSAAVAAVLLGSLLCHPAAAQDGWNPFPTETETRRPVRQSRNQTLPPGTGTERPENPGSPAIESDDLPPPTPPLPADGTPPARPLARPSPYYTPPPATPAPPVAEGSRGVERGELAPVLANDGSGLPADLWQGLDAATAEQMLSKVELPVRSPTLHGLWRRLMSSPSPPGNATASFSIWRSDALLRAGLLKDASASLSQDASAANDPATLPMLARLELALGRNDTGCGHVKTVISSKSAGAKTARAEAILALGLCAAVTGNTAGAGLAAELARNEGLAQQLDIGLLDAVANGGRPRINKTRPVGPIEYRLLQIAKAGDDPQILERATPALAAMIAADEQAGARTRLLAAEAAARFNALSATELAGIYRALATPGAAETPPEGGAPIEAAQRRATLFKAAEAERTPLKKVRLIRSFLDESRRAGLYFPALEMIAPIANTVIAVPEIGWFAETAIEASLAAGDYDRARAWAGFAATLDRPGGNRNAETGLSHWLALTDIADPAYPRQNRGRDLAHVEDLALRGRFDTTMLHRLATVLDALDYNVPMRLWEAASRTPQPTTGHLPATGILTQLQDAARKKEFSRTVLLALATLGANGADGAHMIALGDTIRGLRKAGLDKEARRIALEALFAGWPRTLSN